MKRSVFLFLVFLLFLSVSIYPKNTEKKSRREKTRVAILPFSIDGNLEKSFANVMFENFCNVMINGDLYSVVERGQIDKALNELKFQRGDIFDDSQAAQLGKMAGAQIVVLGNVSYAIGKYHFNIRGIDVTTGIAAFGKQLQSKREDILLYKVRKLAKKW